MIMISTFRVNKKGSNQTKDGVEHARISVNIAQASSPIPAHSQSDTDVKHIKLFDRNRVAQQQLARPWIRGPTMATSVSPVGPDI